MSAPPPDDRAVGAEDPEATRRRLERIFGERLDEAGPDEEPHRHYVAAPEVPIASRPPVSGSPGPSGRKSPIPQRSPSPPSPSESRAPRSRREAPPRRRRLRIRPRLRWFTLYLPLLLLALVLVAGLWAWRRFEVLDRVDLGDALATPTSGAVNYLVVGSDARDGIDADAPDAGAIGVGVTGRRADTIIVLRVGDGAPSMMSIPRDLWVTNVATRREGRINGAYSQGPANLVRTVTSNLGIPINHYTEIGFASFAAMVDAMGGITIDFAHPAFDSHSGLRVDKAGPTVLDGSQALAYVRSRHYTEIIDGRPREDPRADIGRQERQQTFIRTVLADASSTRNPITLAKLGSSVGDGVTVDSTWGFGDAWRLVRSLSGGSPRSIVLPTTGARRGRASVLLVSEAAAAESLARFGGRVH